MSKKYDFLTAAPRCNKNNNNNNYNINKNNVIVTITIIFNNNNNKINNLINGYSVILFKSINN